MVYSGCLNQFNSLRTEYIQPYLTSQISGLRHDAPFQKSLLSRTWPPAGRFSASSDDLTSTYVIREAGFFLPSCPPSLIFPRLPSCCFLIPNHHRHHTTTYQLDLSETYVTMTLFGKNHASTNTATPVHADHHKGSRECAATPPPTLSFSFSSLGTRSHHRPMIRRCFFSQAHRGTRAYGSTPDAWAEDQGREGERYQASAGGCRQTLSC